jgi:hypothetical protein
MTEEFKDKATRCATISILNITGNLTNQLNGADAFF